MPSAQCPSKERIAQLLEGRLAGDELASAEEHLLTCSKCRKFAARVADSIPPSPGSGDGAVDDEPVPSSRAEPPPLKRNDRVGRYVILDFIGAGGMGRVYAAHDPTLDRKVALKLLRPDVAIADLEVRLLREAKSMARISHPHVIAVHDAGRHEDQVYLAMEFIEGGTLRQWIAGGSRSWQEILKVYIQAGRGLAEAHAAGIIHRDFKPDNVLVGDDGKVVRVTDFGLARAANADGVAPPSVAYPGGGSVPPEALGSLLARTGALVGTPVYMAPEQHTGQPASARSDIFSFCVALYEALYGERPFMASNLPGLRIAKLLDRVNAAPEGHVIPQPIRKLLLWGLRAKPSDRPASMTALLDALERAEGRKPRLAWIAALVRRGLGGSID